MCVFVCLCVCLYIHVFIDLMVRAIELCMTSGVFISSPVLPL